MMHAALRTLAALFGLLFQCWRHAAADTGRQAAMFAVVPAGIITLSTIRADLAGLFLVMGSCALLGAVRGSVTLLVVPWHPHGGHRRPARGLIADGVTPDALRSLAVEIVGALVLGSASLAVRRCAASTRCAARAACAGRHPSLARPSPSSAHLAMCWCGASSIRACRTSWATTVPDGLHVGLCGSGSPMPDATRSGPCVLVIAGRQAFVVDVGEGGPRKLALMGVQPALIQGVLLTHFHSDHIGGLGELLLQRWTTGSHTDKMPAYGPQASSASSMVSTWRISSTPDTAWLITATRRFPVRCRRRSAPVHDCRRLGCLAGRPAARRLDHHRVSRQSHADLSCRRLPLRLRWPLGRDQR